jgi:predicted N-acetyltransferase YhbS
MDQVIEGLVIKRATQQDFDQIHLFNHSIFAEEIPQHEQQADNRLVDHFHEQNSYILATISEEIVGMVCYNAVRPFSLDKKLENLDAYLPNHNSLVEVRLFSVKKELRKSGIGISMLKVLIPDLIGKGYDLGVISGTPREMQLYLSIGAVTFGPVVGTEEVPYQPMYFSLDTLKGAFKL